MSNAEPYTEDMFLNDRPLVINLDENRQDETIRIIGMGRDVELDYLELSTATHIHLINCGRVDLTQANAALLNIRATNVKCLTLPPAERVPNLEFVQLNSTELAYLVDWCEYTNLRGVNFKNVCAKVVAGLGNDWPASVVAAHLDLTVQLPLNVQAAQSTTNARRLITRG